MIAFVSAARWLGNQKSYPQSSASASANVISAVSRKWSGFQSDSDTATERSFHKRVEYRASPVSILASRRSCVRLTSVWLTLSMRAPSALTKLTTGADNTASASRITHVYKVVETESSAIWPLSSSIRLWSTSSLG